MISTPYFDDLQKLSKRTSTNRNQNNQIAFSLRKKGFSPSEINDITETECFINPREYKKKKCTRCGVYKVYVCFHPKRAKCIICERKTSKEHYKTFKHIRDARKEINDDRFTTKDKIKYGLL